MPADDLYRQLLDTAPDAIVVVDEDGRIVVVNLQTERLFLYPRDDLIGQHVEILIPERFRMTHVGHRQGFGGAPRVRPMGSGFELHGRRRDGREFPIEISLSPLHTDAGILVSASIRDVTERVQREQVVRRLAAIVDSTQDAIIGKTLDGTITSWNQSASRIFGHAAEAVIGRLSTVILPEDRQDEDRDLLARIVRGEAIENLETRRRHADGHLFDALVTFSPVRDRSGGIVAASSVVRDISERKRMEAQARRLQDNLLSAIESIQGAFAIFDAADRMVLCNSAARVLFEPGGGERVTGVAFTDLARRLVPSGGLLEYHRRPQGAFEAPMADGRHLRVVSRRTPEGGTVMLVTDVTDEVRHEEELRRARAQAEAASSAKSEFLSSMSHELRTPLNAVLGFTQLLQRDRREPLSARQQERVGHVLLGGKHLLRLIDEVLDLSRIEAGRVTVSLEEVDVGAVLAEVLLTLEPLATRAEVGLTLDPVPGDLPTITADHTRFRQILMNYGSNALKYGRRGGRAIFRAQAHEGRVRVTVHDDGIGIPDDKQDKIFSPFHRAGQEAGAIEGTGIGLAITKRLAELMGGTVGFTSRFGHGSEFWIELPAHAPAARPRPGNGTGAPAETSALGLAEGSLHTIVYIEDNPSNIAFMKDLLGDFAGVRLVTAASAELGLELARAHRPDVIIMDINLPGMSGLEATRRLRAWPETRDIPVIGLSAAAMVRDTSRVAEAGFQRYLTKPVKVDELTRALGDLLGRR